MSADQSVARAAVPTARAAVGRRGAVSAGHALAADAAADALRAGGNAVDAAIAGSAVQCVVELPWCGLGGDAFVLLRTAAGETAALNGSGVAPRRIEDVLAAGAVVPRFGPLSVAVPGLVDTWERLAVRFGSRPLSALLPPAISLAHDGVELDERHAHALAGTAAEFPALATGLGISDVAAGSLLRLPTLGHSLELIADGGADAFYRGRLAKQIADHVAQRGGVLDVDDLAGHEAAWSAPVRTMYRDAAVLTQPPVSMGCVLLQALATLAHFDVGALPPGRAELVDLLVRCKHEVFADALFALGDPDWVDVAVDSLLAGTRTAALAANIRSGDRRGHGDDRRLPLVPDGSDTTSLAVADADGMVVTFIHSLFNEFGAREVVDGTGIVLNDRLAHLAVDPRHPNGLAGGKRPVHTLHTYLVERADGSVFGGATPGGRGQVQTNLQVIVNVVDHGDDVQLAVDRSRWVSGLPRRSAPDDTLYLEASFPDVTVAELTARGHHVAVMPPEPNDPFGCCTVVAVNGPRSELAVAADHRRNAVAVAW